MESDVLIYRVVVINLFRLLLGNFFAGTGHARDQCGLSRAWPAPATHHLERYFDIHYKAARGRSIKQSIIEDFFKRKSFKDDVKMGRIFGKTFFRLTFPT
jgi:hypothetical protein